MATKLSALGAPIALLALVLVLMANGGSSAAPSTEVGGGGVGEGSGAGGAGADAIARLMDKNGNLVGVVRFVREEGVVEVKARVRNVEPAAEFHGFHVHATGECDPNAVDPATGAVVPFFSAGGHLNPAGAVHGEHAGDFPVLLVQSDGHAQAKFDTAKIKGWTCYKRRTWSRASFSPSNARARFFCGTLPSIPTGCTAPVQTPHSPGSVPLP